MTACGKTHYLLDMLEKEYENHYDYIFIVCPTLEDNKTYQQWKYLTNPDVYELPVTHDNVENILREITHFAKNTNSLIILDDCAASTLNHISPILYFFHIACIYFILLSFFI